MLRDFAYFLRSLWNEWKVLLTGGSIVAGIYILSSLQPRFLPRQINWIVLGLTLMLASFFTWRKEWARNERGLIDISVEQLTRSLKGKTEIYEKTLVKPYLGKRIKLSGSLVNVTRYAPFLWLVHFRISSAAGRAADVSVIVNMTGWKAQAYIPIPAGAIVTVIGRIKHIDAWKIELTGSDLIGVEDAP